MNIPMDRLREHGSRVQTSKCSFARAELTYLGHVINRTGTRPDRSLVDAIVNFPRPSSTSQVHSFMGLSGYYRVYIENFATVAAPLTMLLRKDVTFEWGEEQERAFDRLKQALSSYPVLHYADFRREFFVKTDFSHIAIGAVLSQIDDDGNEYPIAYVSRRCQGKESSYSARRGEAVALWFAVKKWRPFLEGQAFTVISDHLSLAFLRKPQDDEKLQRIVNELEHFTFKVTYRRGKDHVDADALSRCHADDQQRRFDLDIVDDDEHLFDHILNINSSTRNIFDPVSPETIVQAQKTDPDVLASEDTFEDNNGVLCRRSQHGLVQILVPRSLHRTFLELAHTHRTAGHFGQDRTLQILKRFAYWKDMKKDVTQFCRGCLVPKVLPAWTEIHVDHYGPLNRTSSGNFRYILTVICASSRSVRFIPVKDTSAITTAKALLSVFAMESFPLKMTSDRGSAFTSTLMRSLAKLLGMHLATTVAYRAKANAMAERPHSFLRACLCAMSNESQTDWNEFVDHISLSYRSCVHPALGETPFFLERRRDPRMPQETLIAVSHVQDSEDVHRLRSKLIERMGRAREVAVEFDQKMVQKNATMYDANRYDVRFNVGQLVWVFREPRPASTLDPSRRSTKLEKHCSGPWRVMSSPQDNNYRLQHTRTGTEDTFNVDCLVPVVITEWSADADGLDETLPSDSDSDHHGPDAAGVDTADDSSDDDSAYNESDDEPLGRYKEGGRCSARRGLPTDPARRQLRPTPDRRSREAAAGVSGHAA